MIIKRILFLLESGASGNNNTVINLFYSKVNLINNLVFNGKVNKNISVSQFYQKSKNDQQVLV